MAVGDEKIAVEITAATDRFRAGMAQAGQITQEFAGTVERAIGGLSAPIAKFNSLLLTVAGVAGGGFLFKDFLETTQRVTGETKRLADTFGITLSAASELRTELVSVGLTTDAYAAAALKLDRQMRSNESELKNLGLATRDANGKFVDQATLMKNAIATLAQYGAGHARNTVALQLFGRNVSDANAFLKLNAEAMAKAAKDADELGLKLGSADTTRVKEFNKAQAQLDLTLQGIKKTIGDGVMPALTDVANFFRGEGPNSIGVIQKSIIASIAAWYGLKAGIDDSRVSLQRWVQAWALAGDFRFMEAAALSWENITRKSTAVATAFFDTAKYALRAYGKDVRDSLQQINDIYNAVGIKGPVVTMEGKGEGKELPDPRKLAIAQLEGAKIVSEGVIKARMSENDQLLALGRITNEQHLQAKLVLQQQLDAIDIKALEAERDRQAQGTVEWQEYQNKVLKIRQDASLREKAILDQLAVEQRKIYTDLAKSINATMESSLSSLIQTIGDKTKSIADVFKSLLGSLQKAFSDFAAKGLMNMVLGSLSGGSGVGGTAGGIGGLIGSLFAGFKAGGGPVPPGRWAIAGENGPEIIAGGSQGATVFPGGMGGNTTTIHNNIDARGSAGTNEVFAAIQRGMQSAIDQAVALAPGAVMNHQNRMT